MKCPSCGGYVSGKVCFDCGFDASRRKKSRLVAVDAYSLAVGVMLLGLYWIASHPEILAEFLRGH
jgi:hypothetical protein